MATTRHPQAKAHEGDREPENEKPAGQARQGRQTKIAVVSPNDNAATSQQDGKRNRPPQPSPRDRGLLLPAGACSRPVPSVDSAPSLGLGTLRSQNGRLLAVLGPSYD